MNLIPDRRTARASDVVPMINIAFLLLIFFLVMARMVPPDPFDVTAPQADGSAVEAREALFVSSQGRLAFNDLTGEAAFQAAVRHETLHLRADAGLGAELFAELTARLADAGVRSINLSTVSP